MLKLIVSRKFVLMALTLLAMIMAEYGKFLDPEKAVGFVILSISFIVSVAVNPSYVSSKWKEFVSKREFWVWLVGEVFMFSDAFGIKLPISQESVIEIASVVGAFIVASSYQRRDIL